MAATVQVGGMLKNQLGRPLNTFFAVTAPGLAPITAQELRRMGTLVGADAGTPVTVGAGGVEFSGDNATLYRANLRLRTASRVLVRLGEFWAENFAVLRKRAGRLNWEHYLAPGQPVALRVTCHKSRLYHSSAVADRVAGAIGDRLGKPPDVQKFDEEGDGPLPQLIVVRLDHDFCTISMDTSGELLHRRGYRLATAKAPLRETLAAGMVLAAGWNPAANPPPPLLDPFCGSGTIPIEAAMMALELAPGRGRRFAFMDWPDFDAVLWSQLLAAAEEEHRHVLANVAGRLQIQGSDRDAGAIRAAQANAERAGVAAHIAFSCRAVSAIEPPAELGWVVTNPPYGRRVRGGPDLRNLYAQFGNVLRTQCPGWRLALLSTDRRLLSQIGVPLETLLSVVNGGIPATVSRGIIKGQPPAGS